MIIDEDQLKEQLFRASQLIESGGHAQAIEKLMSLERIVTPPVANIRWLMGNAFTKLDDHLQAIENYSAAFKLNSNLPFVEFKEDDIEFRISDVPGSDASVLFLKELYDDIYGLKDLDLCKDDVVIDIGANVGFVSIFLAKKFPFLKILAFEPCGNTYNVLKSNLSVNHVDNVEPFNFAVSGDGRDLNLLKAPHNSGMANAFLTEKLIQRAIDEHQFTSEISSSKTLDSIFIENKIDRCAFLKLDCEGAEFEIIKNTKVLSKIANISAELHVTNQGSPAKVSSQTISDNFWKLINESTPYPPNLRVSSIVHVAVE